MKTKQIFVCGIFAAMLALALFASCDNGNGTETHTHTWGAWQHNAAQHWQECTANDGAKTTPANHTGDPCDVCGYTAAKIAPDCECEGIAEDCDCGADCECEICDPIITDPDCECEGVEEDCDCGEDCECEICDPTTTAPDCDCEGVEEDCDCGADCDCEPCTPVIPYEYTITGSGTEFTATRGDATVTTGPIQDVINAIRTNAGGANVAIQFGDGVNALNIGTAYAQFTSVGGAWGLITLSGKITGSGTSTISTAGNVSVNSTADISNTYSSNTVARAIFHSSTGTLTISGGTVSTTQYRGIYNGSTGTVNITGGTVSVTGDRQTAVYNYSTGTVNISGGAVSATTGMAVENNSTGKITVSGDALVTSANTGSVTGSPEGTIFSNTGADTSAVRIEITGGRVENTAAASTATRVGNAVYNDSNGPVIISGGEVATLTGYAVQNARAAAQLTLSGSPAITGRIRPSAGMLSVNAAFSPTQVYTLDYASYAANDIAVTGGASFVSSFALYYQPGWKLEASGGDLVIATAVIPTYEYTVTGGGTEFTAVRDGGTTVATGPIQDVITAIRTNAGGANVAIQFGDGESTLNIGTAYAQFTSVGGVWGLITLSGKITSACATASRGTITINDAVSVHSTADIANTYTTNSFNSIIAAICHLSTGTLTISGGTLSTASRVSSIYSSNGTVNITGGTISTTTGVAVTTLSTNTVNISGGTISATTGTAVSVSVNTKLNITGGTISATTGVAVQTAYHAKTTISGDAIITSANTTATQGTVFVTVQMGSDTSAVRLEITGGTVENTAGGNAVYNQNNGPIIISGGTISATTGYALQSSQADAQLILGGSPAITGRIRPMQEKPLSVTTSGDDVFTPAAQVYTLDYASYAAGNIAVTGGAGFLPNFTLHNQSAWKLEESGDDLVIAAN